VRHSSRRAKLDVGESGVGDVSERLPARKAMDNRDFMRVFLAARAKRATGSRRS